MLDGSFFFLLLLNFVTKLKNLFFFTFRAARPCPQWHRGERPPGAEAGAGAGAAGGGGDGGARRAEHDRRPTPSLLETLSSQR